MATIADISSAVIRDSLDNLTIEVTITTNDGILAVDSVPTGVSRGGTEASFVPAPTAVEIVEQVIKPKITGMELDKMDQIDAALLTLDGTPNKERLGANSTLAISLACARAAAKSQHIPLYRYIANIAKTTPAIPKPMMVMIEGGKHGLGNPLTYQEFLVIGKTRLGQSILEELKTRFEQEGIRWNQGSEGGLAPFLPSNESALEILLSIRGEAGLGIDIAASHIKSTGLDLIKLIEKYGLKMVEDPFSESEWSAWAALTKSVGKHVLIVGDDLVTTNIVRLEEAIKKQAANAIIIKPNQIGTLTETLTVARRAKEVGWELVVSHRAGETMDDFIADLAVGVGAKLLKSGSPSQKERLAKYERLKAIAKELNT